LKAHTGGAKEGFFCYSPAEKLLVPEREFRDDQVRKKGEAGERHYGARKKPQRDAKSKKKKKVSKSAEDGVFAR